MRAATARIITAYSVGMRWRASLLAFHGIGISSKKRSAEVCHRGSHSTLPNGLPNGLPNAAVLDHKPPRRNSRHRDVGFERVRARPDRFPGDHVEHEAAAKRHV